MDSRLRFEIEAWARPSSEAVHVLYSCLQLAKEIQLNMWVRFCQSAARLAGGRALRWCEDSHPGRRDLLRSAA